MFLFVLFLGLYSYGLFFLGLLRLLYTDIILAFSIFYILGALWVFHEMGGNLFFLYRTYWDSIWKNLKYFKKDALSLLFFLLLIIQAGVNLIGALGPELAFDALWYHLTLPKIYLENHFVFYIPGGLLYYSAMPKFAEMLYIPALAIHGEIAVKLMHYSFGLLTSLVVFLIARRLFTFRLAFLAVVIFYSNLVVAWESITAYTDLIRAFFEILALWFFVQWYQKDEKKALLKSSIMLGFAVATKLLAFGSLGIFSFLIVYKYLFSFRQSSKNLYGNLFIRLLVYWLIVLVIPLPWFIFAYIHTGNPVYPFFTALYPVESAGSLNPVHIISELWILFTQAADPISPMYLIVFPFVVVFFKKFKPEVKIVTLYSLLALLIWYITPRTGGGRFILPYLPAFSLVCVALLDQLFRQKRNQYIVRTLLVVIIFISLVTIVYRSIANYKYLPVIIGNETKADFLKQNLNFSFGDFYDTDNYFKNHITDKDKVLLYGFHNLYYVDFPYIDATWVKKGDRFNYVAVQGISLPDRFKDWKLIYSNKTTLVNLYSGGREWAY